MDLLRSMRIFVRVADAGSFAEASRRLDIAPSAATRAVADLEDELGARLLNRTTRRIALTGAGSRYLDAARTILAQLDDAAALAGQANERPAGTVRVRAESAFAARVLAPRLVRLHAAMPQLTVEIDATGAVETADPAHDLTIVITAERLDGDFVAHRLASADWLVCGAPGHLARAGRPLHPAQLERHPLLLPQAQAARRPLTFAPREAGGAGAFTVVPPAPPLAAANAELCLEAALAGLGLAALPSYLVAAALQERRLELVLGDWQLGTLEVWACLPSRRHVPARTRALLDFLRAEFGAGDDDPWWPGAHGGGRRRVMPASPAPAAELCS